MNLQAHAINATLQLEKYTKSSHTLSVGVIGISPSILAHTSQYFHHIQFKYFWKLPHFSTEILGNVISPKSQERKRGGTKR